MELLKKLRIFLASIFKVIRQRDFRFSLRHIQVVWIVTMNLRTQIQILHALASPGYRTLVFTKPRFAFKYVGDDYLARGFSAAERASCFLCHYRRLNATFPSLLLRQIFQQGFMIYEAQQGDTRYSITMGLPSWEFQEGELLLEIQVDKVRIYVLQFTMIPGWVIRSQAKEVILVSRIQGVRECYPLVQSTTKAFHDVAPPTLLIAALQGVARALGIDELASVTSDKQICFSLDQPETFKTGYDEFFAQQGATLSAANFFVMPVGLEEKPLDHVKNGHKARKKKRRAVRQQLADDVAHLILQKCSQSVELPAEPAQSPRIEPKPQIRSLA